MSFPNTITAAGGPSIGFPGPFLAANGAMYVATQASGANPFTLSVLKSTDSGVTWVLMDDADAPGCNLGGSLGCAFDGINIWCACGDASGTAEQVSWFDTITDTWQGSTITGNAAVGSSDGLGCAYRAFDGAFIVAGAVNAFAIGGYSRTGFFVYNTNTHTAGPWISMGSAAAGAENWTCTAILQGIGELDFFMSAVSGISSSIYRQPLQAPANLGPLTLIDTVASGNTSAQGFSDGVTALIIWNNAFPSLIATVYQAPVSTWVFAKQSVSMPATETALGSVGITVVSGNAFAFMEDAVSGDVYIVQDSGSGFGVSILLGVQPVNVQPESLWASRISSTEWGIVFGLGPVYFWSGTLAAAAAPVNPIQIRIVPFPKGKDPCCYCPPLVSCVKCGPGGKMLVMSKTQ